MSTNHYSGHRVREGDAIQILSTPPRDPRQFFNDFVAKRCPDGGKEFACSAWTNTYLKDVAGGGEIEVERRESTSQQFGRGTVKVKQSFREFLRAVENGDESCYLTTQNIAEDEHGPLELFGSPVTELLHDIPLVPHILGNLVPYQLNMWMGNSKDGASSGLHHDFHDNLYVLLRGKKRFTLFSPNCAASLYVRGAIEHVYPNGLVCYKHVQRPREDGSFESAVHQLKLRVLEEEMSSREQELADMQEGGAPDDRIEEVQRKLQCIEEQMEEMLERTLGDAHGDGVEWDGMSSEGENSDEDKGERDATAGGSNHSAVEHDNENEDAHFSQIPTNMLHGLADNTQFPLFARVAKHRLSVELRAGEALYLPAGWFHEVTSFAAENSEDDKPGHLALNYWTYPPSSGKFEHPYVDSHWATVHARRVLAARQRPHGPEEEQHGEHGQRKTPASPSRVALPEKRSRTRDDEINGDEILKRHKAQ